MLLRHIHYFIAVAEHGNFTRAAEALHVSQPTLSLQIKQLEESLGAQLLDRSGRVVQPTDAGKAYLQYARTALRELQMGQRAIHDVKDLSRGSLRIAMTPTFTTYLIGPLIENFTKSFPGIQLSVQEMTQHKIETSLAEDVLDLGIAFSQVNSMEIEATPLFVEQLSMVVGAAHPLARQKSNGSLTALKTQSLALLTNDFATRQQIDAFFRKEAITPRIAVEANSIGAIVEIVRRTPLATILPDLIAHEYVGLSSIALKPALPRRTAALLSRKGAYGTAAALAFKRLILGSVDGVSRTARRKAAPIQR